MIVADSIEQGEAVGAGHHDIGEDEVVVGILLEARHCCFRAVGCGCGVAAVFKECCYDGSCGFFVVDNQDSFLRHGWFRPDFCIGGGSGFVTFFIAFFDFFQEGAEEIFRGFQWVFLGGWSKKHGFSMVKSWFFCGDRVK